MILKKSVFAAVVAMLLVCILPSSSIAQTQASLESPADAQTIRNIIAQMEKGNKVPYTENRVFVSGAFPKPMVGKEMSAENQAAQERMNKERLNFSSKHRIERLEVAKAGDMAYEFGYADLSWDTPEQKHVSFESSYLRVWRKVDGQWKVDAHFARPNEPAKVQ